MTRESVTHAYVRELFDYCPNTGALTWKRAKGGRGKAGQQVGWLHSNGRREVGVDGKHYFAHRLIWVWMTGNWPNGEIDHKNHLPDDNRWENLRDVVKVENGRNLPLKKNNKSGVNGVFWSRGRRKWMAQITLEGKPRHVGCFATLEEAAAARQQANIKHGYYENHGAKRDGAI